VVKECYKEKGIKKEDKTRIKEAKKRIYQKIAQ
jgi:hypothetical protein